jgi:ATP/maltotriose-dependent transcriptional regulator MalT
MPKRRAQLAKLTPPRVHGAVARERLFRLLDAKRRHPVLWVSGPPGAGKTTLIASYLEKSGVPALWYHLDRADSDAATLFYYLAQAVAFSSPRRARRLPLLTPEYLPDLEGFGRRFLRDAFARLPSGTLLVFDNFHEIAEDSPVHRTLNAALAEVPETGNVIVVSRAPPPAVFARLEVTDALVTIGWDELRLSLEETAAIAATRRGDLSSKAVEAIHARTDGWVAGVRLLLDRTATNDASASLAAALAPGDRRSRARVGQAVARRRTRGGSLRLVRAGRRLGGCGAAVRGPCAHSHRARALADVGAMGQGAAPDSDPEQSVDTLLAGAIEDADRPWGGPRDAGRCAPFLSRA